VRRSALLLVLACLALAACAAPGDNGREQPRGFYGGVGGGLVRP